MTGKKRVLSAGLDQIPLQDADVIVTLCGEEVCPVAPGQRRIRELLVE